MCNLYFRLILAAICILSVSILSPASAAISYCGEIKESTLGGLARVRLHSALEKSNDSVEILYCDSQNTCKSTFYLPASELISIEWNEYLKLIINLRLLSENRKLIAINYSPRGSEYSPSIALIDLTDKSKEKSLGILVFNQSQCVNAPSPISIEKY